MEGRKVNNSRMTMQLILLPAAFLLMLSQTFAAESVPVKMRMVAKEFSLASDQKLTINHSTLPRQYRVCVETDQQDLALVVTGDGISHEIGSGDCWHLQAKEIIIEPAGRLDNEVEVRGSYFRIRY